MTLNPQPPLQPTETAVGTKSLADAAVEFLRLAVAGKVSEAYGSYAAPDFRHHNPWFRGDAKSLAEGMADNAAKNPGKALEVLRTLAEGDLVAVHCRVRMKAESPWIALIHIFRFENGRIVELWDVSQAPPDDSPNEYGMF